MDWNEQAEQITPEEITPEELELVAEQCLRLPLHGLAARLRIAAAACSGGASTIRALQARVAEAERRAMPEGWIPLCVVPDNDSLAQEQVFSIERSTEPGNETRWCVFFGATRIGDVAGYKILADAIRAAETREEGNDVP